MKSIIFFISFCFWGGNLMAQSIQGYLTNDQQEPLFGATISWEGTTSGTVADEKGWYQLQRLDTTSVLNLLVDYVGYETMVFEILPQEDTINLAIEGISNLMEVEVAAKQRDHYFSTIQTLNVETIGSGELKKAACCSLADCFETNASVDVSYADAITGSREIEMLGLRGIYTQMLVEKRPALNGLGTSLGMEFLPGTWLQGISIAKGAGSVQSGFNAITGQINSELKKPFLDYPVFVNLYGSTQGRFEANVHLNKDFGNAWSSGLLLHAGSMQNKMDQNGDNYLEMPLKKTLNGMYRLFYRTNEWRSQINVHGINDERYGGDVRDGDAFFHIQQHNQRVEVFGKVGFVGFEKPSTSVGFIYNASWHKLNNYYGPITHIGTQRNLYGQLMYEGILGNEDHKFSAGANFLYDDYEEQLDDTNNDRTEKVPGIFAEYTKVNNSNIYNTFFDKVGVVAGLRVDKHNLFDWLVSPRLNLKYNFNENTIIRFSAGQAYRTPNIIAENLSIFASSRQLVLPTEPIEIETAVNLGVNFTHSFKWNERDGQIAADFYRTNFSQQVVIDLDEKHNQAIFYNLEGKSYSNSFLALVSYNLFDQLSMKVAYKFNDVKIDYLSGLRQKPLVARHRGLVTVDYNTKNKLWSFSTNAQFVGQQRFPDNSGRPAELVKDHTDMAPSYALLNAQLTRKFKRWDIYLGGENLTNYTQNNPIISGENWQSEYFDASQIYAPVMGIRGYLGIRWWIDK